LKLNVDAPGMRDECQGDATAALFGSGCRWNGITPRSANDCLIAQYAARTHMPLLHNDRDFPAIAKHLPELKLLDPK
jgi:predicted nucleic acid-binding protein